MNPKQAIRRLIVALVSAFLACWGALLLLGTIAGDAVSRYLRETGLAEFLMGHANYHFGLIRDTLANRGDGFLIGTTIFFCGLLTAILLRKRPSTPRRIDTECLVYLLCILILCVARKGAASFASVPLWSFFILSVALCCAPDDSAAYAALDRAIRRFLEKKALIFGLCLGTLFIWFIGHYPTGEWGMQVALDDYSKFFCHLRQGAGIIRQGAFFGWSSSFLGGQFTAAYDATLSLSALLMILSSVMKPAIAYHIMWLASFFAFPVLCYFYVKSFAGCDKRPAVLAVPIACYFELSYFADLLRWGMLPSFAGLSMALLALILFRRLRNGSRHDLFYLVLTLSLLLYTHLGTFIYAVLFIAFDCALDPGNRGLRPLLGAGGLLIAVAAPYLFYKIAYPSYLIVDNVHYAPMPVSFGAPYWANVLIWLFTIFHKYPMLNIMRYPLLFIPVTLYIFRANGWRVVAVYAFFSVGALIFFQNYIGFAFSRIMYLMPLLTAILLSGFLIINYDKRSFGKLLILVASSLILLNPANVTAPAPFRHFDPELYNRPLIEKLKELEGRYVAVENNTHFVKTKGAHLPDFVWLPTLQAESGRLIFGNPGPWYVHSPYRANSFDSGEFRGKPLGAWPAEEVDAILKRWGVGYLVMWSRQAKEFFGERPDLYEKTWNYGDWSLYKVRDPDLRSATVEDGGEATVSDMDYFEKRIGLAGVTKGSMVTVRSNYFPAWKAYYGGIAVPIRDMSGQIGFTAPASGNMTIIMKYPRYVLLSVVAFLGLAASWILSFGRWPLRGSSR